jgi:NTE family protein
MTTAWVLPGGASLGAIQVGQAAALLAWGLEPDLLIGSSVGSVNAAWLAADPTVGGLDVLRRLWLGTARRRVFPISPVGVALGVAGRRDHTVTNRALTRWLEEYLPYHQIEEARLPLTITATDLQTGEAVFLSQGSVVPALVASCAIPGVFPPVALGGRILVDGGMVADAPIARAVAQGADRIYVLPTLGRGPNRPRGALDLLLRSIGLILGATRAAAINSWADHSEIYMLPAPSVAAASAFSFRRGQELMNAAEQLTAAWLPTARPVAPPPAADLRPGWDGGAPT